MTKRKRRTFKEIYFGRKMLRDPVEKQFDQYQADTRAKLIEYYAESFMLFVYLAVGVVHIGADAPLPVVIFLAGLWSYGFRLTLISWWTAREWLDAMLDLPCVLFRIRG